jgi:predicted transcriptional regulator
MKGRETELDYFDYVVNRMDIDELSVLGILFDNEATVVFKAIPGKDIMGMANLSKSKFYRLLNRLSSAGFVECSKGLNYSKIYLTQYGVEALEKSLEGEDVEC